MSERWRKRPVVIEAVRYVPGPGGTCQTVADFLGWTEARFEADHDEPCDPETQWIIPTLEGEMAANPGDWIIRGVKGEFYPCKPDIFAATYEPADAPAPSDDGRFHDIAHGVTEAYTPEGQAIWWRAWAMHPDQRARMEAGMLAAWSGEPTDDVDPGPVSVSRDEPTHTEWGVVNPDDPSLVIEVEDEAEARETSRPVKSDPRSWPVVARQVTEWKRVDDE